MHAIAFRLALTIVGTIAMAGLPRAATADVVTGTVTPADATVVIVDKSGATVAQLIFGRYVWVFEISGAVPPAGRGAAMGSGARANSGADCDRSMM